MTNFENWLNYIPRGHTLTGLFLAGLLLGHVPAVIAGSAESKIEQLRYLPAFLFSEERRDRSWWLNLRYEVACGISAHQLNEYAEMRIRQMCGGDFRYLSYSEDSRDETDPEKFCYKIDIVAECIHDEAEPEHQ